LNSALVETRQDLAGQNDFSTFVRKNLLQLTEIDIPMKVIYSLSATDLITKGEYEELWRAMKYIHYRDLAKLAKSTTLSKNLEEFFDELSLSPDVMQQAVRNINRDAT